MSRILAPLLCLLLAVPAQSDEQPVPRGPVTPEQAADAVLLAYAAKDGNTLRAMSATYGWAPWIVAEVLCDRGQYDAAEAFAKAAPRKEVEKLPAYVASRRGQQLQPAIKKVFDAAWAALSKNNAQAAVDATEGLTAEGHTVLAVRTAWLRGSALRALHRLAESAKVFHAAGAAALKFGWLGGARTAYLESGNSAYTYGDMQAAMASYGEALALAELLGDDRNVSSTLMNLGSVRQALGDYRGALEHYEKALAIKRKGGASVAIILGNIGIVHAMLWDNAKALVHFKQALQEMEQLGDRGGAARMRGNIAILHRNQGDWHKAMALFQEAFAAYRALGNDRGAADALGNIGTIQQALGKYPEALASYEQAWGEKRRIGDRRGAAATLGDIGGVYYSLGNYAEALSASEQALKEMQDLGDRSRAAQILGHIGLLHAKRGDFAKALAFLERARDLYVELEVRAGVARMLADMGSIHAILGDNAKALESLVAALEESKALSDLAAVASTHARIAHVWDDLGKGSLAIQAYVDALEILTTTPHAPTHVSVLQGMAELYLRRDQPEKALVSARKGVEMVMRMAVGFSEGVGAHARELSAGLFDVGTRAAMRLDRPESVLWFLEQGRAGSLREGLGSRDALEAAVIPKTIRTKLVAARAAEQRGLGAYRQAAKGDDPALVEQARGAWEHAQAEVQKVETRLQREHKAAAGITLAETDTLDVIRGYVRKGEAVVLYGLTAEEGVALVIEQSGARIVTLDASSTLAKEATRLLHLGEKPGSRGFVFGPAEPTVDTTKAAVHLRGLLVDPLRLGAHVTRVLVSPTGSLGYLPFALLLPNKEVAYIPSGTTLGLLLPERHERGTKILGVGNPDYQTIVNAEASALHRGATALEGLAALPGTLKEVNGIGGVPLLGQSATESGVRIAIGKEPRWRSVHFACHGLVNAENPRLSALAITADKQDDGFLTCLEILRMKVPADLVVMSACETGKGKIYMTEGILGLTRAFMFTGAPRVICSLWKVDDEATSALMVKFYELWNPQEGQGLSVAAALQQAQAHIKGHDKWKDPYYWAAWVLWGLPE